MKSYRTITVFAVITMITAIIGCKRQNTVSGNTEKMQVLKIAYQYGLAYAPVVIARQKGYIENIYEANTGNKLNITWNQMSSGADINTAFLSRDLDAGFLGATVAITGISKEVGYKVFTNISLQEYGLMTNDKNIASLADLIGSNKQIALVNIGAAAHIILGMALVNSGFGAHILDNNLVAMKNPDGLNSLMAGSVSCNLTYSQYLSIERESVNLHEINEVSSVGKTLIVGIASKALFDDRDLYNALCEGIEKGRELVEKQTEEAAEIICELDGFSVKDELKYLAAGNYKAETQGLFKLASFMADNGFIESRIASYADMVYGNVEGD